MFEPVFGIDLTGAGGLACRRGVGRVEVEVMKRLIAAAAVVVLGGCGAGGRVSTTERVSTTAAVVVGETPERPVPVGGERTVNDWTVSVLSADLDATDQIYYDPAPGGKYALVGIEITYRGEGKSESGGEIDFHLFYSGRVQTDVGCGLMFISIPDEYEAWSEQFAGEPVRGNICFEIPEGVEGMLLVVERSGWFSDSTRRYFALPAGG